MFPTCQHWTGVSIAIVVLVQCHTIRSALRPSCLSQQGLRGGTSSLTLRELFLDVECVATGPGHNDRSPCWIAVVDMNDRVLVDQIVKVEGVFSHLTNITGLTENDLISQGVSLEEAMTAVRCVLGPDVKLIGQAIQSDIQWLNLSRGVDFSQALDIADEFKCFNRKHRRLEFFSLAQTVHGLLGESIHGAASHSPVEDCRAVLRLYRKFIKTGKARSASMRLREMRIQKQFPEWTVSHKRPVIDGVCHFKFHRDKCFCGQPTSGQQ